MQLISPNLQSFHCQVIKKVTHCEGHYLFFAILNQSSAQKNDCQNIVQQVVVFQTDNKSNADVEKTIENDNELTLFADANFTKQTLIQTPNIDQIVALQPPNQKVQLLYPKALQLMPYPRLLKEAFLTAIPWIGLLISLLSLAFSLSNASKSKNNKRKLRFTFPLSFHLLNTTVCCYPVLLIYFSLNQYMPFTIVLSYFVLCLLNYSASKQRNTNVESYNQAIRKLIDV
jgi:hypothetical protein